MNGWISVENMLPNDYESVIIVNSDKCRCLAHIERGMDKKPYFVTGMRTRATNVTHWVPLPAPPEDTRRWCATCGDLLDDDELPICDTCLTAYGYRKETT